MITKWPLPGNPLLNLVVEEILYRNCSGKLKGKILLWVNRRSVIAGRLSRNGLDYSCEHARKLGVPVYRRFTGGGAVYHDESILSITYIGGKWGTLREVYDNGTNIIVEALRVLDLKPRVVNEGDIIVGKCKVGGSAAHVGKNKFLYHATLNFDIPPEVVFLTPPRIDRIVKEGLNPLKYKPCGLKRLVDSSDDIISSLHVVSSRKGLEITLLWEEVRSCGLARAIIGEVIRRVRDPYWQPCKHTRI